MHELPVLCSYGLFFLCLLKKPSTLISLFFLKSNHHYCLFVFCFGMGEEVLYF